MIFLFHTMPCCYDSLSAEKRLLRDCSFDFNAKIFFHFSNSALKGKSL